MKNYNLNYKLIVIFVFFLFIYASISLVNHYLFRTYALDLGMFNHAIYSFSHFKLDYFTLNVCVDEVNYFSDHFSLITILISPFYYLFGSYTLLVIQIVSIIFGGYGIYKYAQLRFDNNNNLALIIVVHLFSIWGIYSALSFDFHTNVLAAMFVPWLIYFYEKQEKRYFLLFFFLILISKENMALWLVFILFALMLKNRKKGLQLFHFEAPLLIFSSIYFIVVSFYIMPSLNEGFGTQQISRYSILGNSFGQIISTIINNPKYVFSLLFESPYNDSFYFGIKSELHFMVLLSGGFALLYRPVYLIMLIPIYAQKLFSDNIEIWGIDSHYSIEFVPIISIALIEFISGLNSNTKKYIASISIVAITIAATISSIDKRKAPFYNKTKIAFYNKIHYSTQINIKQAYRALNTIPDDVPVSANSMLAPHLAFRDKIYHFPVVKDAKYVALLLENDYYPLQKEGFQEKIKELIDSKEFVKLFENKDILILKRVHYKFTFL